MTVFVESNFILELALGQEQVNAAEALLRLAEQSAIDLAIPSFALSEPFATIAHRARERKKLISQVKSQLQELERSRPHLGDVERLRPMPDTRSAIELREASLLDATVGRLWSVARWLDADTSTFEHAMRLKLDYDLASQDAMILATIMGELTRLPVQTDHYFVSKNWRDFGNPRILRELRLRRCTFVTSFDEALRLIRPASS